MISEVIASHFARKVFYAESYAIQANRSCYSNLAQSYLHNGLLICFISVKLFVGLHGAN